MKNLKFIILALLVSATSAFTVSAQDKGKEEWKERVMSEKIAFITAKLSLTPEEAQVFWPVYNKLSKERGNAFAQIAKTYKTLNQAVEGGNEKEISNALDAYTKALDSSRFTESEALAQYRKVLSDEKIAKLFLAEEQFRHQQISRLQKPGAGPEGQKPGASPEGQKPRPDGQKPEFGGEPR